MRPRPSRLIATAAFGLVLAACAGGDNTDGTAEGEAAAAADSGADEGDSGDDAEPADGGDSGGAPDGFPEREIELVVPFSAGGSIDGLARQLAPVWEEQLGVPVTVSNPEGSGGQLGFANIWNDPGEGHRVLVAVEPYLSTAVLQGADYGIEDWAAINIQEFDPVTITVREDSPFQTLADLVDHAQENPGDLSYATVPGGAIQIVPRALQEMLDLDMREVTFDGGEETRAAMLSGEVDVATSTTSGDLALHGEEARVLGMATNDPPPHLSELPTINDELSDYDVTVPQQGSTRFLAVPRSVAEEFPERFQFLVDTYEAAFNSDAYQEAVGAPYEAMTYNGPEASDQLMQEMFEAAQQFEDVLLGG